MKNEGTISVPGMGTADSDAKILSSFDNLGTAGQLPDYNAVSGPNSNSMAVLALKNAGVTNIPVVTDAVSQGYCNPKKPEPRPLPARLVKEETY